MQIQRRNEIFWATLYPFVTILMTAGTYFVMYFGGVHVLDGTMTPASSSSSGLRRDAVRPARVCIAAAPDAGVAGQFLERLYDILDEEPDIRDQPDSEEHEIGGDVEFEG